jgi:hypothetical protein
MLIESVDFALFPNCILDYLPSVYSLASASRFKFLAYCLLTHPQSANLPAIEQDLIAYIPYAVMISYQCAVHVRDSDRMMFLALLTPHGESSSTMIQGPR